MTKLASSLPLAQWLGRPTGVWEVMGSVLFGDSDQFFFVPRSWQTEHSTLPYFVTELKVNHLSFWLSYSGFSCTILKWKPLFKVTVLFRNNQCVKCWWLCFCVFCFKSTDSNFRIRETERSLWKQRTCRHGTENELTDKDVIRVFHFSWNWFVLSEEKRWLFIAIWAYILRQFP